ncbi:MAG: amino acid adenylation domain-containing protein [Acidobacteriota bacterium]
MTVLERSVEGFQLSPPQRDLWEQQRATRSAAFRTRCAVVITGPLDLTGLRGALSRVIRRHEILRTVFHLSSELAAPLQVITDDIAELQVEPGGDFEGYGRELRIDAIFRRFALEDGADSADGIGLELRARLVQLEAQSHLLLLGLPALCMDQLGMRQLVREIVDAYAAGSFVEEPVQYADLSEWLSSLLEDAEDEDELPWRRPELWSLRSQRLPFEQSLNGDAEFTPRTLSLTLAPGRVATIEAVGEKYGAGLDIVLLAGWHLLLGHLAHRSETLVGASSNGRSYEELTTALGLFEKSLPSSCSWLPETRFADVLRRLVEVSQEIFETQEYFSWDQVRPEAGGTEATFWPYCFAFEAPPEPWSADGLEFRICRELALTHLFHLKLSCQTDARGLVIDLLYDPRRFTAAEMQRMLRGYRALLEAAAESPESSVAALEPLSVEDRHRQLIELNDTWAALPEVGLHQLFERQVRAVAENTAAIHEAERMSFAELNARANQLARYLRRQGCGPETTVALYLERSLDALVAMLAVLKSGGAYVPLEVDQPERRLASILEACRPRAIVAHERLGTRRQVLEATGARLVWLDDELSQQAIAQQEDGNLELTSAPESLAYVLFTSGSTGRSKGVCVEHRQIVSYVLGMAEQLALPARPAFATVSTLAADLGNTAIFGALCYGGTLHLISRERAIHPAALADYADQHRIDCLKIVPSHLEALLTPAHGSRLLPRRSLVLGGEACRWRLIEAVSELAPELDIFNHYGPTETTVGVLSHRVTGRERPPAAATVPIGSPFPNTLRFVLDGDLRPRSLWATGELFLGGAGLSRGYLRQPASTAQAFVPNPFGERPGERLYRTGDRVRQLPAGVVEFLGRIDRQIKLRGFRIEIGEIEACLASCPAVAETVVEVRKDAVGEQRLVAYTVLADEVEVGALREYLAARLPDHMVPSDLIMLPVMPLTANGKVDRQALPYPSQQELTVGYVAPRTQAEQLLAAIWEDLLGQERVGSGDDFFRLGGHSLLVVQQIARVEETFGVELPLPVVFENPMLRDLAQRLEAMANEQEGATPPAIEPMPSAAEKVLSFAQERLWFLEQFEPGTAAYNIAVALRITGRLEVDALRRSLEHIVSRHELLRSSYPAVEGRPVVHVESAGAIELPTVDLSGLSEPHRSITSRRLAIDEARKPVDATRPALLRLRLLAVGPEEYHLLLTVHHIVADAWSRNLFVSELLASYRSYSRGGVPALKALPIQYADFAYWQRRWLRGEVLEGQIAYWREQLGGLQPLDLPTDRPRPGVQTYRGSRIAFGLPSSLRRELTQLGRERGCTLFMTLAAAFQILLHRHSGQHDFAVGTPTLNRTRAATEDLIGLFLNMLVLRSDVDDAVTFGDLLQRVRKTMMGAMAHRELPFEKLVEELQPERTTSHSPLFQVMFTLQSLRFENLDLPGLGVSQVEIPNTTAKFDLTLYLEEEGEALSGVMEYKSDLFDATTIQRMLAQYRHLLTGLCRRADAPASSGALLGAPEKQQMLVEWNDRELIRPERETLCQRFELQASQVPDAIAVSGGGACLSYAELDRQAEGLARRLRSWNLAPESLIGVCLDRDPKMLVALLAVLKADCAYLPLDPMFPRPRLAFMLEDARAAGLITEASMVEALPEYRGPRIELDSLGSEDSAPVLGQSSTGVARRSGDVAPLAYTIYTSGSTGRPKGVQICHGSLENFLESMRCMLGFSAGDRLLSVTTLSFDIAGLELFLPLICGGEVRIAGRDEAADASQLRKLLVRSSSSFMQATPATWRALVEVGWSGSAGLTALCGGEALPPDLAAALTARSGELFNVYGPTETTIWSAAHRVSKTSQAVPLGRPIANTQLALYHPYPRLVPVGVAGQLYIGGEGLARGYRRRPALTASTFVPAVGCRRPGARLYATGDLCRWRADGALQFLGRVDHQVKVRGFRIELGEIEAHLADHPAVREAVVTLHERGPMGAGLAAYVVGRDGEVPSPAELRASLAQRLPEYMLPSTFIEMQALPRTPNEKIDRKALPQPQPHASSSPKVAARTPLERDLCVLWSQLLAVDDVGIDDNFFELGGHSLLATRLMFRVHQTLGIEPPLRVVFEQPTVRELAQALDRIKAKGDGEASLSTLPTIVPDGQNHHEPFALSDVQHAYWIGRSKAFELGNVGSHTYRELALPELDVERLQIALRRLIDRHDMLRAIVLPDGQQQILPSVPAYEIPVLDLRGSAPEESRRRLAEVRDHMSHQVFETDRWPLFEVQASVLDGGLVRIHIGLDYLIADGWSIRLMARDLSRFYDNPDLELPVLELSFRDYIIFEQELQQSETYQRSKSYWSRRLDSLPPAPELPLVTEPGSLRQPRFVRRHGQLDFASWQRVQKRAARLGVTPSSLLLTVFAEILARWSKSPRFTLNITLFNRLPVHPEIDDVVGDFTSLNLLEVDASARIPFELRARSIQEQLWEDLEHRLAGGIQVMRELARRRGQIAAALMPVVFTSFLIHGRSPARSQPARRDESAAAGTGLVYNITQTPQVWLDHQVTERDGELIFNWDAIEALLPAGLLDDMFEAYCGLLRDLASREESWDAVDHRLLPERQLETRASMNATEVAAPDELLHVPFLRRATEQPEELAVIDPRRSLSYGELRGLAGGLARRLAADGARCGKPIAVVMEKGWEQVVAVLGILEAGAAYLPIDPALPHQRLLHLLEKGEIEQAVIQPWLEDKLDWPETIRRIPVDAAESETSELVLTPFTAASHPDDLAYVIFTSGSTGSPKGVAIRHRGAMNTIVDINRRFRIEAGDRVLGLSSLSFDLSVYDVFGILAAGGTLVLPGSTAARDPGHWLDLIRRHRVTVWNSVPALMEMLVEHEVAEGLGDLRLVMLSGDWIPVTLPERVQEVTGGTELVSLGGATEASIWSILYPIDRVDPTWHSIPYGRPMDNQRFHVLNERWAPCPTWVPGQLYIGGLGLADGYWRDEERTSASFIRHPETGERLYRTGDLGRYQPDGNIEFLGREDNQVKVRGYRIELGEIEAVLERHPRVRAAAVAAAGEARAKKRLIAYVVASGVTAQASAQPPRAAKSPTPPLTTSGVAVSGMNADERTAFVLSEPGLRRDVEELPYLDLPALAGRADCGRDDRPRRTHRRFQPSAVTAEQISALLASLSQLRFEDSALPKYRYPSAGSLYPVQVYVHARDERVSGLSEGFYYYHPKDHRLVRLAEQVALDRGLYAEVNRPVYDGAAFGIFLIANLAAIEPLYGAVARDFSLLEAGYMGQLLMSTAPDAELGLCPIGAVEIDGLRSAFGLGAEHELLHSFLGGAVKSAAATTVARSETSRATLVDQLQAVCAQELPAYMVPAQFVLMDSLPLSANGKVDRTALPTPGEVSSKPTYAAPKTELQRQLAEIWQSVLGVDRVGLDDNFFDLGGDSITLVQVHNQLRTTLNLEISIVQLFANPNLSALSQALDNPAEAAEVDEGRQRAEARRSARGRRRRRHRRPNHGAGDDIHG